MSQIETLSQPQAVSMADEWFQFATPDHFWMQWRHRLVLRAITRACTPLRRALEIGCGNGVARSMLERDLGIAVDGCDLNRTALEMAKPGKGRLFVYDILEQEPSLLGLYDAVFLLDVIEHINDDAAFLIAALRHLRPGGLVVVNVPANMLLFSDYDRVSGHVRRYSQGQLRKLFLCCALDTVTVQSWGLLMAPLLFLRKALLRRTRTTEAILRRGFMPPNEIVEVLLHALKNIETALPFPMPFGTSVLGCGRRRSSSDV
jgi:2-polyprenyl-3-methyl-5-hydroxy-6-metoxy-1,4-benzoquinol methylase